MTNNITKSWGYSIFSDDIRAEIGGKLSLIGVYHGDIIFPASVVFPAILPKIAILIRYFEAVNAYTDDITIRVFFPGDQKDAPSIEMPFGRPTLADPGYAIEEDQEKYLSISTPLVLSPVTIKQAGFIKVRAACGPVTTNLGSIMVRVATAEENIVFSPQPAQAV